MLTWFRSRHPALASIVATAAICLAIAIAVWLLFGNFFASLVVSLCIGFSIHGFKELALRTLGPRKPGLKAWLIAPPAGILTGLALSGALLYGQAFYFLSSETSTLVLGVMFGIIGSLVFQSWESARHLRKKLADERARRVMQEKQLVETQLRLLQAQMEPHFLFNTLSNIAGHIDTAPAVAQDMLQGLTKLLRASLERTRKVHVALTEELDVVDAYLQIQALRMGQRLRYRIDCPDELLHEIVPPLLIQPVVENAVRHGIEPRIEGGDIDVIVAAEADVLSISVTDNGIGLEGSERSGNGVSLVNLRERMDALYGDRARLSVRPRVSGGTRVDIRLPRAHERMQP